MNQSNNPTGRLVDLAEAWENITGPTIAELQDAGALAESRQPIPIVTLLDNGCGTADLFIGKVFLAAASTTDNARRLAACWNAFDGIPTLAVAGLADAGGVASLNTQLTTLQRKLNGSNLATQRANDRFYAAGADRDTARHRVDLLTTAMRTILELSASAPGRDVFGKIATEALAGAENADGVFQQLVDALKQCKLALLTDTTDDRAMAHVRADAALTAAGAP